MPKFFVISSLVILLGLNSLCCLGGESVEQEVQSSEAVTQPAAPAGIETATSVPQVEAPTAVPVPTLVPLPGISINDTRVYNVSETILVQNEGPGDARDIEFYIALPVTISPFQTRLTLDIDPPDYTLISDKYMNQFAYIKAPALKAGDEMEITVSTRVAVNGVSVDTGDCLGELPQHDTGAEEYLEVNAPEIQQLSRSLAQGKADACQVTRSIYDYVGSNMQYAGYNPGGIGALQALQTLSGDCTEYADLMIALARAADIPALYVTGVTCCTESGYVEAENKHNWVLTYLPDVGWAPMDPTWGRNQADGDAYFASMTPDHIILTRGRNLETVNNYHYYYFHYYWDGTKAELNAKATWSILPAQ